MPPPHQGEYMVPLHALFDTKFGIDHGVGHPIWGCSRRISSSKKIPDEIQHLPSYLKDAWDDLCVNFPSRSYWDLGLLKRAAQ